MSGDPDTLSHAHLLRRSGTDGAPLRRDELRSSPKHSSRPYRHFSPELNYDPSVIGERHITHESGKVVYLRGDERPVTAQPEDSIFTMAAF